jgi:integrase
LEAAYVLPATVGLRQGECLSLRHEDIDFDKGTLKLRRTVWRNNVYPPKTPRSRRTIKLPNLALDANPKSVAMQMGWSSVAFMLENYARFLPGWCDMWCHPLR